MASSTPPYASLSIASRAAVSRLSFRAAIAPRAARRFRSAPRIKVKKNLTEQTGVKCARLLPSGTRGAGPDVNLRERDMRINDSFEGARQPVSFVEKLAGSEAFAAMFREGMTLVEEAAAYLDGAGRDEAKVLHAPRRCPRPPRA